MDVNNVAETDERVEEVDTPAPEDEPKAEVKAKPEAKLEVVHEPETPKQPEFQQMQVFPEPNFPDCTAFPD